MHPPRFRRVLSTLTGLAVGVGAAALPTPATAADVPATPAAAGSSTAPLDVVDIAMPPSASPRRALLLGATSNGQIWTHEPDVSSPVQAHDGTGAVVRERRDGFATGQLHGDHWMIVEHDLVRWSHVDSHADGAQEWTDLRLSEGREAITGVPGAALAWERRPEQGDRLPLVVHDQGDGTTRDAAVPSTEDSPEASPVESARPLDDRFVMVNRRDGADIVDLRASTAWGLPTSGTCAGPRGVTTGTVGNDVRVAWLGHDRDEDVSVCTATLTPGTAGEALTVTETSVAHDEVLPHAGTDPYQVLPVADGVVISAATHPVAGNDLVLVTTDGTVTTLIADAGGVAPAFPASTTGESGVVTIALREGTPTLARVSAASSATGADERIEWLSHTWPRDAFTRAIALDGDRLAVVDDRTAHGSLTQYTVNRNGATESSTLTTVPRDDVVLARDSAGRPLTLFGTSPKEPADAGHVLRVGDESRSLPWQLGKFTSTDGRHALSGSRLVDLNTGAHTDDHRRWTGIAQGLAWRTDPRVAGLAPQVVIQDLATGLSQSHVAPECVRTPEAQLAGSHLLVQCSGSLTHLTWLLDLRTGTWTSVDRRHSDLHLGNGFLLGVSREPSPNMLWWLPLDDLDGTPRAVPGTSPDTWTGNVAVTTESTSTPSFAWATTSRENAVHVAFPDVTPSPAHTISSGVRLPSPIEVAHAVAGDRTARVEWNRSPASEKVDAYKVTALTASGSEVASSVVPENDTTTRHRATFALPTTYYVSVDTPVTFRVTALNAAGATTGPTTAAFPRQAAPAAPDLLQMTRDLAGRHTVSWSWQAAPPRRPTTGVQDLSGFRVVVGGMVMETGTPGNLLTPSTRSFRIPGGITFGATHVVVEAVGSLESTPSARVPATIDGVQSVDPRDRGSVTIPRVTTGSTAYLTLSRVPSALVRAQDVQVRITPAQGKRGAWKSPAHLQRLDVSTGKRRVQLTGIAPGAQWCVRTRGRDVLGATSQWTEAVCTVRAFDDRAFSPRSLTRGVKAKATRLRSAQYAARTATRLGATGAAGRATVLEGPRTSGHQGWLVATTCPTCGKVRVEISTRGATTTSRTINLRSKRTRHQVLVKVPDLGSLPGGTVRIVRVSGKPVIDGIALHR